MKKLLFFTLIFLLPLVLSGNVTRSFSNSNPLVGEEIIVSLIFNFDANDLSYFVQENLPVEAFLVNKGNFTNTSNILRLEGVASSSSLVKRETYKISFSSPGVYSFGSDISFASYTSLLGATTISVGSVTDSDSDGIIDAFDKCVSPTLSRSRLNGFGCPIPNASKFDIRPNFSNMDLNSVSNLTLGLSGIGIINFSGNNLNLSRVVSGNFIQLNFNDYVNISKNRIEVNSANLPELNKPAVITLYSTGLINPVIFKDGSNCTSCSILTWDNISRNIIFSVPSFSVYEALEYVAACVPSWNCTTWSNTDKSCGTRTCVDTRSCGTTNNRPSLSSNCPSAGSTSVCGNNICNSDENCSTCSSDCGLCSSISSPYCGDGICRGSPFETCTSCSSDCGSCPIINTNKCGDGICTEDKISCPQDCADSGSSGILFAVLGVIFALFLLVAFIVYKLVFQKPISP